MYMLSGIINQLFIHSFSNVDNISDIPCFENNIPLYARI